MQVGSLVRHWRFTDNLLGVVVELDAYQHITEYKVKWADGSCGWYSPDRLEVI